MSDDVDPASYGCAASLFLLFVGATIAVLILSAGAALFLIRLAWRVAFGPGGFAL